MTSERRNKLMIRWSLVTGLAIAVFWGVWALVTGEPVPVVTAILITPEYTLKLPFGISRWWDVLIGPAYSVVLISIFTNEKVRKDKDLVIGLVFGLGVGLVYGLGIGLVFGLVFGLGIGLAVGLVIGLVYGLVFGLGVGLVYGLGIGLVVGLGIGLVYGLVFGLGVGLGVGLVFGLVYGLVALLKLVFSMRFWSAIGGWLTAKDKA